MTRFLPRKPMTPCNLQLAPTSADRLQLLIFQAELLRRGRRVSSIAPLTPVTTVVPTERMTSLPPPPSDE